MKRVTGIGGIFFKSKDPKALGAWYKTHLGIDVQPWGGAAFDWNGPDNPHAVGTTAWSLFPADSKKFAPSAAPLGSSSSRCTEDLDSRTSDRQ